MDMITMSDMAYTVVVVRNGHEVWNSEHDFCKEHGYKSMKDLKGVPANERPKYEKKYPEPRVHRPPRRQDEVPRAWLAQSGG